MMKKAGARKKTGDRGIILYHLYFQIIKINRIYKIILIKSSLGMPFKLCDRGVQPERFAQIKFITDLVQGH